MEVYKFGGASVKGAEAVKHVAQILAKEHGPKVLVFSAMGKTTNALETLLNAFFRQEANRAELFKALMADHIGIFQALFEPETQRYVLVQRLLKEKFEQLYQRLLEAAVLPYDQAYDSIVSYGERLSTLLIVNYLQEKGLPVEALDAADLIRTDSRYRDAGVLWEPTIRQIRASVLPLLERGTWVVTQGFIGGDGQGRTTTLGREGSDYSAAILAHSIDACQVTIWKDVPGVLNADPKYFANTCKLAHISYNDATELAYFGASVIHPKTIKPLQNKHIPLYVRSFVQPDEPGTWVGLDNVAYAAVPSYIFKPNQILLSVYPKDFSFIEEIGLAHIFELLARHGLKVNMMQNSALSFSLCLDATKGSFPDLLSALSSDFDCVYNEGVDLVTIRHYTPEVIGQVVNGRTVLLEQRTRHTVQLVVENRRISQ
ncbi:MAG: aspartate kinase [Bacteroidales bacterium]|nr:aspartate kinase [Bacteroidales bacterium]